MKRILYSLLALWLVLSCEETRLPSLVEWCPSIDESALGDVPKPDSYKITVSNNIDISAADNAKTITVVDLGNLK